MEGLSELYIRERMSSAGNDPRQPSAAKPYVAPVVPPENLPIDYSGFIAIIFGVAGAMFRVLRLLYLSSFESIDLLFPTNLM